MGVTRLVAPGPLVAMQTPTLPVATAYPCAAWPAPCSWRTRMCRILLSKSGSYAGRIGAARDAEDVLHAGALQGLDQALRTGDRPGSLGGVMAGPFTAF